MKKDLEILSDCPVCGIKYPKQNVKIASVKQSALLVHMDCDQCKSSSLALVSRNVAFGESFVSMGMLTDLSFEEVDSMLNKAPITVDEVLDVREGLEVLRNF